ncbi:MAG: poly(3-hydroxybutyrate) depolymerase [Burkholderiales bacterium]
MQSVLMLTAGRVSRLGLAGIFLFANAGCGESQSERIARREKELAAAPYAQSGDKPCQAGTGAAGYSELRTAKGIRFTVVAPSNYDSTRRHPLLVVYAPASSGRLETERVTSFTQPATHAGFIAAYADHPSMSVESTKELGTIASLVTVKWCVDESRVFYSGHSDGGTVSHALAVLPGVRGRAAGIAPSAAGMTAQDLAAYGCPALMAVMVMHSKRDKLFPGWGEQTAKWWAQCNRCDAGRTISQPNGCVAFQGCDPRGPTLYCEGDGTHSKWPGRAQAIMDFFQAVARKAAP